ncbi:MAG: hypothetical protein RL577_48 [Bacteroidota bacterium]
MALAIGVQAQATLPTSWDFTTIASPPTGWNKDLSKNNGNETYSGGGYYVSGPFAIKFDGSGEYLMINFSSKPDTLQYWIRGTGSNSWEGQFAVEESADGNSWSTVRSYNNDMPLTYVQVIDKLKTSSRYVRFIFSSKASGFNVAMDDVYIGPAAGGLLPEIKVSYQGTEQVQGAEIQNGSDTSIVLSVKNISTVEDLEIKSVTFSGAAASNFSVKTTLPLVLKPGENSDLVLGMSATASGSYKAEASINSNDSENGSYKLNLYGIVGGLASQPVGIPALAISSNKAYRLFATTSHSNADAIIILQGSDMPQDGKVYEQGSYVGNSRVVYVGGSGDLEIDKIIANTQYEFYAYAVNGYGSYLNYTDSSNYVLVTTPGLEAGTYYNGISTSDTQFVAKLRAKVNPHFRVYYSNYINTVVNNFEAYDTVGGQRVMECFYSGWKQVFTEPFVFNSMSREHSYPYSWMGEGSQDSANYSDLFILWTVNQNGANAVRSNYPLGIVKTVSSEFYAGKFGRDSLGEFVYEPRDWAKGALARSNFYICATYNKADKPFTIPTANTFLGTDQDQYILKEWNTQFPPSNWEMARCEYIASVQGNRNPFVDHPEWACYIDFSDMSFVPEGDDCERKVSRVVKSDIREVRVYPNPSSDRCQIDLSAFAGQEVSVSVVDYFERVVMNQTTQGGTTLAIPMADLASGTYLILVKAESGAQAASALVKP